jgi:hypothetical protein
MIKKTKIMFAALLVALFTGCEGVGTDIIVDWYPVNIYIYATDSTGNSIIGPDMPGMSLTYKGETYTVKDYNEIHTRAYLAILYGLYAQKDYDSYSTGYRLVFGEIDGAADMDEDITLNWPDGSTDVIHYHCSDHKEGKNPRCNRNWKLNGKKHDGGIFHFTGKSLKQD